VQEVLHFITSLGRLPSKQGRRNEVRNTLGEIYNWFT
jgi:hypothetical protein